MTVAANPVEVAAPVGDTARATMLAALMNGQALTSSELAGAAHVSRATASEHLSKLTKAQLWTVTQKRERGSRAMSIIPAGRRGLRDTFALELN